jgi:hypothetical protein
MVVLSEQLQNCVNRKCFLQLRYDQEDREFYLQWYYHGALGGVSINFDPWSGQELRCKYAYEYVEEYERYIKNEQELCQRLEVGCFLYECSSRRCESGKKRLSEFLEKFGPVDSKKNRKWWDNNIERWKSEHLGDGVCSEIFDFLRGGDHPYVTLIIHIPNIRTYAILNKKECGGFEPMDYCPFCGAIFPQRLDNQLTEILRSEYGLDSWKDYKKAPAEFHSDKWWRKRGL